MGGWDFSEIVVMGWWKIFARNGVKIRNGGVGFVMGGWENFKVSVAYLFSNEGWFWNGGLIHLYGLCDQVLPKNMRLDSKYAKTKNYVNYVRYTMLISFLGWDIWLLWEYQNKTLIYN